MLEPQNKPNVEFQPSKKMKKRRELDALVCNGKVRRKSKSGHELLRTESDSSEIDEFSIEAQKTLFRNRGQSSCSSCKTVIGFFLLGTCLVISAGLIWLHFDMKNSIQILQERVITVDGKNKDSTLELDRVAKQVEDLQKQLESYTSKDSNQITDLNKQIEDLKKSTEDIKSASNVESKQELQKQLGQLTQIPILSKTVAGIGSDVENLKTKIEELNSFKQTSAKQLDGIKQKLLQTDDRESKPFYADSQDISQKIDILQKTVDELNFTTWNKIIMIDSELNVHQMKFDVLENRTAQIQYQLTSNTNEHHNPQPGTGLVIPEDIQKQIEDKVKDSLKQMDKWTCSECQELNSQLQRYCLKCWKKCPGCLSETGSREKRQLKDFCFYGNESSGCSPCKLICKSQENYVLFPVHTFETQLDKNTSMSRSSTGYNSSNSHLKSASFNCPPFIEVDRSSSTTDSIPIAEVDQAVSPADCLPVAKVDQSSQTKQNNDGQSHSGTFAIAVTEPCIICKKLPKTACIVHGTIGHQVCCFRCAMRLKRLEKKCPVCRQSIQKVIKNFVF